MFVNNFLQVFLNFFKAWFFKPPFCDSLIILSLHNYFVNTFFRCFLLHFAYFIYVTELHKNLLLMKQV